MIIQYSFQPITVTVDGTTTDLKDEERTVVRGPFFIKNIEVPIKVRPLTKVTWLRDVQA